MPEVKIGEVAPDFTLPTKDGDSFSLSAALGQQPLVVFFYPRDFSANCTKEACAFRDNYAAFQRLGAEVIGISSDTPDSHRSFAAQYYLPYILLSDPDNRVRELWGVPKAFGVLTGRVTYVLDLKGVVRGRYESQVNINGHLQEAMACIRKISREGA
jgi:peroxiredoxin Q/BCP